MSNIAIQVENLSKEYRLGEIGTGTLSNDLKRWWYRVRGKEDPFLKVGETNDRTTKGTSDYVWALKDINFEINQGDRVGIIGRNGAGKSTLLKILAKTTTPTTGSIKVKGRVASLLEVGTGFHGDLSGRDNIFLNGAILGMSKKEIRAKFDEIVDFAGVERYVDTPVKRYSSGMYVRLAFAVAAYLEPDILIVDEVLAVGDAEFQKKAIGKMNDVSEKDGRTILFVSHNIGAIQQLCNRGIAMINGSVRYVGTTDDSIDYYLSLGQKNGNENWINNNPQPTDIKRISIINMNNKLNNIIRFDESTVVNFDVTIADDKIIPSLCLGVTVTDKQERKVFSKNLILKNMINKIGDYQLQMIIPPALLVPNHYAVSASLHIPNQSFVGCRDASINFSIEDTSNQYFMFQGVDIGCVNVDCKWELV